MDNEKLEESKLQGLCKICMRRKRCPKAKQYLSLKDCTAFKVHKRRGKKHGE